MRLELSEDSISYFMLTGDVVLKVWMCFSPVRVDVSQTLELPILLGINAPPKCCIDRKLIRFGNLCSLGICH